MLFAGLRLGESCIKQPLTGNVLLVNRQRLPNGQPSTSKTQGPVMIPEWLAAEYKDYKFERGNSTVGNGILRAARKAKIIMRPQILRHYATELVRHSATPEVLRSQMRHSDVTISLKYYVHTTPSDIDEVIKKL